MSSMTKYIMFNLIFEYVKFSYYKNSREKSRVNFAFYAVFLCFGIKFRMIIDITIISPQKVKVKRRWKIRYALLENR